MAVKKILRMGNPLLRERSASLSLDEIRSEQTKVLMQDLLDTMNEYQGVGIAAPQIGVMKRAAWVGIEEDNSRYPDASKIDLVAVFNPIIRVLDETPQVNWEGCLSVPGLRGEVVRPLAVEVEYFDQDACRQIIKAEGFPAAVFQHEISTLR